MKNSNEPQKKIRDIVRKLLNSNDVSIKTAALYLNCTEQSFRNKLSRDSFSLKDLIIICYLCNARFMIEYFTYKENYDLDYFDPSEYLPKDDYERIHKIEEQNINHNFAVMMTQLSKDIPAEILEKMSPKELLDLMIESTKEKLNIDANSNNKDSNIS